MDQMKIGSFLKELRLEKGLTQLQLAEQLNVSNRSVSRWETGSTLPDISMMIELANFYKVDIKEIIYGERKNESAGDDTNESLVAVANYSNDVNKKKTVRIVILMLFVFTVILAILISVLSNRSIEDFFDTYPVYERVHIDKSITDELLDSYILKEMPAADEDHANFCKTSVFSTEKVSEGHYYVYAWVVEETCICEDGVLSKGYGGSYPCRFELTKENGPFAVTGAEKPRDGADNNKDIEKLFPRYVREAIYNVQSDGTVDMLLTDITDQAKRYFNVN